MHTPITAAPAAIASLAPMRSISRPMKGAPSPMATAEREMASEISPRDHPRSAWIGFT
jgi:hypothetical protein